MAQCKDIGFLKISLYDSDGKAYDKRKPSRFDITKITPSMIVESIRNKKLTQAAIDVIGSENKYLSKFNSMRYTNMLNSVIKLTNGMSAGTYIDVNLGFNIIRDAQVAEYNTIENVDLNDVQYKQIMGENPTISWIPKARVVSQIGRAMAYSDGIKLSGKNPTEIELMYKKLGEPVLEELEKQGVIEVSKSQPIVNNRYKAPDGNDIQADGGKIIIGQSAIRINVDSFTDVKDKEFLYRVINGKTTKSDEQRTVNPSFSDTSSTARYVHLLKNPTNIKPPSNQPVPLELRKQHDIGVTETTEEVMEDLHTTALKVNDNLVPMYEVLANEIDQTIDIRTNKEISYDIKQYVFGYDYYAQKNADASQTESIAGENTSKINPVMDFLAFMKEYAAMPDGESKKLFYDAWIVRNARTHIEQTFLNGQAESFFARNVLTDGERDFDEFEIKNPDGSWSNKFLQFVAHIEDMYGISMEAILGKDENFNTFIRVAQHALLENPTYSNINNILGALDTNRKNPNINVLDSIDSIHKLAAVASAIKEINEALDTGTMKTKTFVENDATASGGSITFTQMAGNKKARKILEGLGLFADEDGNVNIEYRDVYQILENRISKDMDTAKNQPKDKIATSKVYAGARELINVMDELGVYKNKRDASKSPTMTFIYGQGKNRSIHGIATDIADTLIRNMSIEGNGKAKEYIESKLGYSIDSDKPFRRHLIQKLSGKDGVAEYMYEALDEEIKRPLTKEREKMLNTLYNKAMYYANGKSIKILPAMAYIDLLEKHGDGYVPSYEDIKKYGIPLTKMLEVYNEKAGVITRSEFANNVSALVVPIHSIDAAIEQLSRLRTNRIMKKKYGKLPIHDAIMALPTYNEVYQHEYIKAFYEVNEKYDVIEQMVHTVNALAGEDIKADDKAEAKAILKQHNIEGKKEFIRSRRINPDYTAEGRKGIFGTNYTEVSAEIDKVLNGTNLSFQNTNETSTEPSVEEIASEPSNKTKNAEIVKTKLYGKLDDAISKSPLLKRAMSNSIMYDIVQNGRFGMDTNTGKIFVDMADNDFQTKLEHEVVHFNTYAYLADNTDSNEYKYVSKAAEQMVGILDKTNLSPEAKKIAEYLGSIESEFERTAELVAFANTEPEAVVELASAVRNTENYKSVKFIDMVRGLIEKIKGFAIDKFSIERMGKYGVDPYNLFGSATYIHEKGLELTNEAGRYVKATSNNAYKGELGYPKAIENALKYRKENGIVVHGDPLSDTIMRVNKNLYDMASAYIGDEGGTIIGDSAQKVDEFLRKKFKFYASASDYLKDQWASNSFIQEMRTTLDFQEFGDFHQRNKLLSLSYQSMQNRNNRDSSEIVAMKRLMNDIPDNEKQKIHDVYAYSSIFHLFTGDNKMIYDFLNGRTPIEEIESKIRRQLNNKDLETEAAEIAAINVNGEVTSKTAVQNRNMTSVPSNEKGELFNKLIALESLKLIDEGAKTLKDTYRLHPELHKSMIEKSLGMYHMMEKFNHKTGNSTDYRESLVQDIFDTPLDIKAIDMRDYRNGKYNEENGWSTLREPTKHTYGIVYRKQDSGNFHEGAGTNIKFSKSDVIVPTDTMIDNVDNVGGNTIGINYHGNIMHKIILTKNEKRQLGLIEDPAESLVRSFSHIESIAETEVIRSTLVHSYMNKKLSNKASVDGLNELITKKSFKTPYFLKLGNNIKYEDLPKSIQNKYRPLRSDEILSDVNGFNTHIDLVRKDAAPWLLGYRTPEIFSDNKELSGVMRLVRNLVAMKKINDVVNNPTKIMRDVVSNYAILGAQGVSVIDMARESKIAYNDLTEIIELRNDWLAAKSFAAAYPDKQSAKNRLMHAESALRKHKASFVLYNGMMSSLSTDIIMKEYDAVTGLNSDIKSFFDKVFGKNKDNPKDINELGKLIMAMSKKGFQGEQLANWLYTKTKDGKFTEPMSHVFKSMREKLTNIKNNDDASQYMMEIMGAPSSEMTKFGSNMLQLSDIIPRMVLYRTMKANGATEDEAVRKALETFIDYKVNLPRSIQTLSDYGIMMYPSFWMRAQKVIFNLFAENPVSMSGELAFSYLTGLDVENIAYSNIFNRAYLFGAPPIDASSVLPVNLFDLNPL